METSERKPNRRWLRFRLRTLLLLITVIGIGLGVTSNAARRQKVAVKAIRDVGGEVWFEHNLNPIPGVPNSKFDRDALPPGPSWLRTMIGDDYFGTANCVVLMHKTITEEELIQISRLPRLITVNLYGATIVDPSTQSPRPIDDSDLIHVQHLTGLHNLVLSSTGVTDKGLERIVKLTELDELYLKNCQITDTAVESLCRHTKLKTIDLRGTAISYEGRQELQKRLPSTRLEW